MRMHAPIREQLQRILPDETLSPGIPPACYASPEWLGEERVRLFRRGWLGLGLAALGIARRCRTA